MEIFRLLCVKSGEELNQRQVAKLIKVSPTAIAKSIPNLEKESLIAYEKKEGVNLSYLKLNRDNKLTLYF